LFQELNLSTILLHAHDYVDAHNILSAEFSVTGESILGSMLHLLMGDVSSGKVFGVAEDAGIYCGAIATYIKMIYNRIYADVNCIFNDDNHRIPDE
jgi:hypothetical protein